MCEPFTSCVTCQITADESGGVFQIRPHKDFTPTKGRDRLLSLRFFSELTADETDQQASPHLSRVSEATDVFESARNHKKVSGDPTTKRRNAAIRLSNFACADSSPLCVRSLF
jgi:DNA mismatch repair protein MSH5